MPGSVKPVPRSCSLRSTQLTTSSDSTGTSSSYEPACFGEWVYWQRDSERHPECWTKVFAVITRDDASICLYQCENMSSRTLVCRHRMWSVTVEGNRRRLKLVDAQGSVIMRLWLLNHANHELWKTCLQSAVQVAALTPPPSMQSNTGNATHNNSQSIVSGMSLASLRRYHETQGTRVSKRSIVKAVCRDAVAQIRGRLQGVAER
ncbi:hypothetical protein Gpo141_00014282 [Globisporangium polare]